MPSVLIIGAGFGGIGMAIELRRSGFTDVTVVEKAAELGGVWRENTYPGAGCDVPSPYYSFSYAPNIGNWPMRYSLQAEIKTYLERTAAEYGISPRYGVEVTDASFVDDRWLVTTAAGETLEADVLIPAVGQLSRPAMPDLPGLDTFTGPAFHSARWDHSVDLTGKRVAVIGTGASAAQFVPHVAARAAELTVFQRTPPYVVPKPDARYRAWQHRPWLHRLERGVFWGTGELATLGLLGNRPVATVVERIALWHLRKQVTDPRLRAKLTPDYAIGCKRVLFSNDYYPALARPNTHVETAPIVEVTPNGVRTDRTFEVDVLIYGTGFTATDFLAPMEIHGRDGLPLSKAWDAGARAYLGMTVPDFPNLFLMYGPNTNIGAGSILYMLERQARYIRQAVSVLAGWSTVEVRPEVADRFDAEVQGRLAGSVWNGCRSWYRSASGRVSTNWPGLVSEYDRRTRTFDLRDYRVGDPR
jgi:cation diffusion facilitator CzcD-associated flavoprotein CzcO